MNIDNREIYIVIGFSKCGTTSLTNYFRLNNIKAAHYMDYNLNNEWISIGYSIMRNKKNNKLLLSDFPHIKAFTQIDWNNMSIDNGLLYPQLTEIPTLMKQYPNAKFILNIRNVSNWINSVKRWHSLHDCFINNELPFLPKGKGRTNQELTTWYNIHTENMINLFKNDKERLYILNIDNYDFNKFNNFCNLYNVKHFPHDNKSEEVFGI